MANLILIYIAYLIVVFCMTFLKKDEYTITPRELYDTSNLNMFGCVLLWFIAFIFNPLFYIACFAEWLCHVGRKD
jgi:hypothetical protein